MTFSRNSEQTTSLKLFVRLVACVLKCLPCLYSIRLWALVTDELKPFVFFCRSVCAAIEDLSDSIAECSLGV